MAVKPKQAYRIPQFNGGLNTRVAPHLIEHSETPDCYNVRSNLRSGSLERTRGYRRFNTTGAEIKQITAFWDGGGGLVGATSTAHGYSNNDTITIFNSDRYNGAYKISSVTADTFKFVATWSVGTNNARCYKHFNITGLYHYQLASALNYFITVMGGKVYRAASGSGANWVSIQGAAPLLSTTKLNDFVTYIDTVIITDAAGHLRKWTGSGNISNLTSDVDVPTQVKCLEVFEHYLVCGNIAGHPSRLHYSQNQLDYTNWSSTTWIDIERDNGGWITGLETYFNELLVFKTNGIYKVHYTGVPATPFSMTKITDKVGCVGNHTVVQVEEKVYFMAKDGFYVYDGHAPRKISDKIQSVFDNINKDYIDVSYGQYFKKIDQIWWAVPTGISTANNMVIAYSYKDDAFWKYTIDDIICMAEVDIYTHNLVFSGSSKSIIYLQDAGGDFDGNTIEYSWKSKLLDFGGYHQQKRITEMYLLFKNYALNDVWLTWVAAGNMVRHRSIHGGFGSRDAVAVGGVSDINNWIDCEKYSTITAAWTLGNNLVGDVHRRYMGDAGTSQNEGLIWGHGDIGETKSNQTQEYDGTNWSLGGNLPVALGRCRGCGTQNAALSAGGVDTANNSVNSVYSYNGTSWSLAAANLNTAKSAGELVGTTTAAIYFGGVNAGADKDITEEFDGFTWSIGGKLSSNRLYHTGVGTAISALSIAGVDGDAVWNVSDRVEYYDGNKWEFRCSYPIQTTTLASAGTSNACLGFGGYNEGFTVSANAAYEYYSGNIQSDMGIWVAGTYMKVDTNAGGDEEIDYVVKTDMDSVQKLFQFRLETIPTDKADNHFTLNDITINFQILERE